MTRELSLKTTGPFVATTALAQPRSKRRLVAAGPENGGGKKLFDPRFAALPTEATCQRGRDGRMVQIPAGFFAAQGRDGRVVAVPAGCGSLEGSDGRVVAIPPGHIGIENPRGRVVPKTRW